MTNLKISRPLTIPDAIRIERYHQAPQLGPKILFFSGGSALRPLARKLIEYTHNSIHIVTPFDSGGSSAIIREAFGILAVGDVRNRLMALADQSVHGNPDVFRLFSTRFPEKADNKDLKEKLINLANAKDPLILKVPNPMRRIIRNHLHYFIERMPVHFDLRGASLGNLVLAGGYLNNRRHIDPVTFMFEKLVEVRGTVKPVTGLSFHLAAELANGKIIVGQHLITHKTKPIKSRIKRLFLTKSLTEQEEAHVTIKKKIRRLIESADLICFPIGSFHTSVIANLLADGVADAIANNGCPKLFIPNPIGDSEQIGLSLSEQVQTLLRYLNRNSSPPYPTEKLLNFLLLDKSNKHYKKPLHQKKLENMGIQIINQPLLSENKAPYFDETKLVETLLSLV